MTEQTTEETLLVQGKVTVTTSRLLIGAKTYAMSNITSVTFGKIPAVKWPGVIVAIAGVCVLLFGIALDFILVGLVVGGAIIALGVWLFTYSKPLYTVRLGSASGEADALSSKNEEWIRKIVSAVNEAIIRRG